jgi:hypothetical protein
VKLKHIVSKMSLSTASSRCRSFSTIYAHMNLQLFKSLYESDTLTAWSIVSKSTSPPGCFDFAASSGNRTEYETARSSRGFFSVSCSLVETYRAARATS